MEPEFKRKTYLEISSIFQNRKDIISKEHANKIDVLQHSIEVSYNIDVGLNSSFYHTYKTTGKEQTGPKALIPLLFIRNFHYLIAVHELASRGIINPSYLNLRAVFEGIMHIYLLQLTDKEADLCYKKEMGKLNPEEEKELKKKYQWLKPSKVRNILYSDTKKNQVDELYKMVSGSAHPTIKGAASDFQLKHLIISDVFDVSLALSAANLIAIHECHIETIGEKEREDIANVLERICKEYDNQMPDLVPNNPQLVEKLNIRFQ